MRALLDVNVIIALLDPDHAFHERAHEWWHIHAKSGWASCPLTENGTVRVMSNPAYSPANPIPAETLISRLRTFAHQTDHEFWPDDISLRDEAIFLAERIHGSRQVTDLYLLALAARHKARLATFDTAIPTSAVRTAKPNNLQVI